MLERIGRESLSEIKTYLADHYLQNILLLDDLYQRTDRAGEGQDHLTLIGYRHEGQVVAVQGFYQYGRWLPHYCDDGAMEALFADMGHRYVRWLMGACEKVDPLWPRLKGMGFRISYDEVGHLCGLDRATFRPFQAEGVRRATARDVPAVASLRCAFDVEYFGTGPGQISKAWCLRLARRYIERGAFVAECDGKLVSMVATEADIPQVTQLGAVYTVPSYRGRGLAKAVVSALCQEKLQIRPQVVLDVRMDNAPARHAYDALGFQHWDDYRMCRLS
ncbi:MAG: GNAT family N-acetyltransferase [Anaerolineae bacterium]|nr:GNAT family N-acetyltransferase [Anaerolineae bacterium]